MTAQARSALHRATEHAGVREIAFHELRHRFGTRMAAASVQLLTIQHWMAHADARTTHVYAHYQPSEAEVQVVDAAFDQGAARPLIGTSRRLT